jgi:hypothetical protein
MELPLTWSIGRTQYQAFRRLPAFTVIWMIKMAQWNTKRFQPSEVELLRGLASIIHNLLFNHIPRFTLCRRNLSRNNRKQEFGMVFQTHLFSLVPLAQCLILTSLIIRWGLQDLPGFIVRHQAPFPCVPLSLHHFHLIGLPHPIASSRNPRGRAVVLRKLCPLITLIPLYMTSHAGTTL